MTKWGTSMGHILGLSILAFTLTTGCGSPDGTDDGSEVDDCIGDSCVAPPEPGQDLCSANECGPGTYCSTTGACITEGTCASFADCGPGLGCSSDGICVPDLSCGGGLVDLHAGKASALIALDRSCSMRNKVDGIAKWTSAVEGINLLTHTSPNIEWGLSLFPDQKVEGDTTGLSYYEGWNNDGCDVEDVALPIADDNVLAINTLLSSALDSSDNNYPNGPCNTPIDSTTVQAHAYLTATTAADPTAEPYLVLITDGKQYGNCNGGVEGAEKHITMLNEAGIRTYVVGFGGGVNVSQLDEYARLGGTARGGETDFYMADNSDELNTLLAEIGNDIASCRYELGETPPADREMLVFFDNTATTDGWVYDSATNSITFDNNGAASPCSRIHRGEMQVAVGFDCPVMVQ